MYSLELIGESTDHRHEARPFELMRTPELSTDDTPEAGTSLLSFFHEVNRSTTTVARPGRRHWWSRR